MIISWFGPRLVPFCILVFVCFGWLFNNFWACFIYQWEGITYVSSSPGWNKSVGEEQTFLYPQGSLGWSNQNDKRQITCVYMGACIHERFRDRKERWVHKTSWARGGVGSLGGFKRSLQNKNKYVVNRSLSWATDKSKEVTSDNLPLWARLLVSVLLGSKGGAEITPEPTAKVMLSWKQSTCHI